MWSPRTWFQRAPRGGPTARAQWPRSCPDRPKRIAEHTESTEAEAHSEFRCGSFLRRVRLPGPIPAEGVDASYEDGILTVRAGRRSGKALHCSGRRQRLPVAHASSLWERGPSGGWKGTVRPCRSPACGDVMKVTERVPVRMRGSGRGPRTARSGSARSGWTLSAPLCTRADLVRCRRAGSVMPTVGPDTGRGAERSGSHTVTTGPPPCPGCARRRSPRCPPGS
ncbi:Hsp20/alpha crystallin family protein [Streptomyces sp. NPDC093801]|uniref:Hsp20/alpha crystallin family protein n=1 Tax=Streptomyces sp. NPDC093801 TaxID=3155203 RepID=UPI00344DB890